MKYVTVLAAFVIVVCLFAFGLFAIVLDRATIRYLHFKVEHTEIEKEAAVWEKKLAESQIPPKGEPSAERLEELTKLLFEDKQALNKKIEEHNDNLVRKGYDKSENVPSEQVVLFQIEQVDT